MRTKHGWLLATVVAMVLSGGGLWGTVAQAGPVNTTVNTYSYVSPHNAGGGANGRMIPESLQTNFYWQQPPVSFPVPGPGKGATANGGSDGQGNPDLYFNFSVTGTFREPPDNATPEMFPDWANQSVQSHLEVRDHSIKFVRDGDTYYAIFKNEFGLNGWGNISAIFYQQEKGGSWTENGFMSAGFDLLPANGARITGLDPSVDHIQIFEDGFQYEQTIVGISGQGMIPGNAYTISSVVPEPATAALLVGGGLVGLLRRKRRQQNTTA